MAYSLLTHASVRNSVPMNARIFSSISSVNFPRASSRVIPEDGGHPSLRLMFIYTNSVSDMRPFDAIASELSSPVSARAVDAQLTTESKTACASGTHQGKGR